MLTAWKCSRCKKFLIQLAPIRSRRWTGLSQQQSSRSSTTQQTRQSNLVCILQKTNIFLSKTISSLFILGCHTSFPPSVCATKSFLRIRWWSLPHWAKGWNGSDLPFKPLLTPHWQSTASNAPTHRHLPFAAVNIQQLQDCHWIILCRRSVSQIMSSSLNLTNSTESLSFSLFILYWIWPACIIPSPKPRMYTDKGTGKSHSKQWILELFFCKVSICDMNVERPNSGQTFLHQGHW